MASEYIGALAWAAVWFSAVLWFVTRRRGR